jgi:hypothetical protein
MTRSVNRGDKSSDFVADGFERLLAAIEAEVRPEIEQRYADEWNASGIFRRWFLLRRIEREIADRVRERSTHISPDSRF